MGNLIIALGIITIFIQWVHPIQYLRLNLLIKRGKEICLISIGLFFLATLIVWAFVFADNITTFTSLEPLWFMVFTGLLFLGYLVFNFSVTVLALKASKEKKKNLHRMLLLIPFAPVFILLSYLIVVIIYSLFGSTYDYDFTNIIKIFNNDQMLVFKLLIRLLLISFVSVMAYIVILYYENITLKVKLNSDENKKIRNSQIEKRLSWKSLGLVFLIGAMISFFHFAEIDTSIYDEKFQIVYQRTLDVFQMIATAVFIPLLFERLHSFSESKKIAPEK